MTQIPGALGLTAQQVDDLLRTAGRAPSLHNSQPWQFRVSERAIELLADPARTLPVADPDGREQRLACGAALFNLRLALHGYGIRPTVTILPDRARPELLAVVRHGGAKEPTPEQTRLLHAVPLWRTNRRPFTAEAVAPPAQHALRRAALDEGAWLHIVDDHDQRTALHTLLSRAHRQQTADPDFEEEPLIAVLTSHLSGTTAEIQVGQALQRVLLTATAGGLATSFLSQVVEVPHTREELRRLIGGTRPPQAVLRFGHGWPVAASPRRDAEDLLAPGPANPT